MFSICVIYWWDHSPCTPLTDTRFREKCGERKSYVRFSILYTYKPLITTLVVIQYTYIPKIIHIRLTKCIAVSKFMNNLLKLLLPLLNSVPVMMLFLSLSEQRGVNKLHIHVNGLSEIIYYTKIDVTDGENYIEHIQKQFWTLYSSAIYILPGQLVQSCCQK